MQKSKISSAINKRSFMPSKRSFRIAGIAATVLLISLASWYLFENFSKDEKVFAQVAGHKIYEEEVRNLLQDTEEVSDRDATEVLADKYLLEELTQEEGVIVTEEEIQKEIERRYGGPIDNYKENNQFAYQRDVNQVYFDKLSAYSSGAYKGKYLIGNFSRNVKSTVTLPEDIMKNPDLGNPNAIEKDKNYARNLLTRLYNEIKSGTLSFEDAIKIEKEDPRLGEKAYSNLPHSGSFDTSVNPDPVLNVESIKDKISDLEPGTISEPFVVEVGVKDDKREAYFLVVRMDESSGGGVNDFESYIEEAKKRLEYVIYV